MRLFIANKIVIIFDHIINLLHYIKLTIFYCVVKLQLNKLLFIIERDKSNIFLVFFNIRTFFTLLLR
jgi:hypothetical protein